MLITLCKFWDYNIIQYLYTLLCAHHWKSSFHLLPYIWPLPPTRTLLWQSPFCGLCKWSQTEKDKSCMISVIKQKSNRRAAWWNKLIGPDNGMRVVLNAGRSWRVFLCGKHIFILSRVKKSTSSFGIDPEQPQMQNIPLLQMFLSVCWAGAPQWNGGSQGTVGRHCHSDGMFSSQSSFPALFCMLTPAVLRRGRRGE